MRYLAFISYDGSKYYGFQKLKGEFTIQGELERALSIINKSQVNVKGAGRTDRGVHAYGQAISFDLNINIPTKNLQKSINSIVDKGIYIWNIKEVKEDFHARFSAIKKEYEYVINIGEFDPIINEHIYNYNTPLNIRKMRKAAKLLVGAHSYKNFTSGPKDNYNSIINKITITQKADFVTIKFIGKSFYRYMVRNIVGALIAVSEEKLTISDIEKMLDDNNEKIKYNTVPANGLYLVKVYY